MRKPIVDEFTNLPVSKQRKYQLRMIRKRRCSICGKAAVGGVSLCLKHLVGARERQRSKQGRKRRNYSSISYRLEYYTPRTKLSGQGSEQAEQAAAAEAAG